ncbi:hypothetical protein U8607_01680 [Methylobacterium durans]|uniref:hypothetical protein n=1 Tax=Methylobacterium durans TaxID=2202825 RepID=UPI002AFECF2C|nr:hypothetical protein [Methylobacterium durans]MEA1830782.1 hypothetical protein [Methylobacterium durans]
MRCSIVVLLLSAGPALALDAGLTPPPEAPPRGARLYGSDFSSFVEDAYGPPQTGSGLRPRIDERIEFPVEPRGEDMGRRSGRP